MTLDGKSPAMLYYGAEYCPYCAAERWAMAVAPGPLRHVGQPPDHRLVAHPTSTPPPTPSASTARPWTAPT